MLEEYSDLMRRFHQALIRRDRNALAGLLTEHAVLDIETAFQQLDKLDLPLAGDVSIIGIEIEGNGKVIRVHYISRFCNKEFHLLVELTEVDEIKINQNMPHLISLDKIKGVRHD
ncbi:MAG: hypothetical protein ACYS0H_15215 [Planctomycetota bacterium]|jgi:hypothetical protein